MPCEGVVAQSKSLLDGSAACVAWRLLSAGLYLGTKLCPHHPQHHDGCSLLAPRFKGRRHLPDGGITWQERRAHNHSPMVEMVYSTQICHQNLTSYYNYPEISCISLILVCGSCLIANSTFHSTQQHRTAIFYTSDFMRISQTVNRKTMVHCFTADWDHTSESHYCYYIYSQERNTRVQNMGFDVQML